MTIYSQSQQIVNRKRGVLNEENIAWLESVFRENVGKGKEEFTLDEFKKIVPSKNVRTMLVLGFKFHTTLMSVCRNFLSSGHSGYLTRMGAAPCLWQSSSRQCTSSPARGTMKKYHFYSKFTI